MPFSSTLFGVGPSSVQSRHSAARVDRMHSRPTSRSNGGVQARLLQFALLQLLALSTFARMHGSVPSDNMFGRALLQTGTTCGTFATGCCKSDPIVAPCATLQSGVDYEGPGITIRTLSGSSSGTCVRQCLSNKSCQFATFYSDNLKCTLRRANATAATQVTKATASRYDVKPCRVSAESIVNNAIPVCTKLTTGSIRFGNTIAPATAAVATLEICVNLCLLTKDCMFAAWNKKLLTCQMSNFQALDNPEQLLPALTWIDVRTCKPISSTFAEGGCKCKAGFNVVLKAFNSPVLGCAPCGAFGSSFAATCCRGESNAGNPPCKVDPTQRIHCGTSKSCELCGQLNQPPCVGPSGTFPPLDPNGCLGGLVVRGTLSPECRNPSDPLIDDGLHAIIAYTQSNLFLFSPPELPRVILDGSQSHTHQEGANLVGFSWTIVATNTVVGTASILDTTTIPAGTHLVVFTITDNFGQSLSLPPFEFTVAPYTAIPGALVRVYNTVDTSKPAPNAIYGEMTSKAAAFSTSSVTLPALTEIVVRMNGLANLPAGAVIAFPGLDVVTNKVFFSLNGVPFNGATSPPITAGIKYIEFRCYLPAMIAFSITVNGAVPSDAFMNTSIIKPIIHALPAGLTALAQRPGSITGFLLKGATLTIGGVVVPATADDISTDGLRTFLWPALLAGPQPIVVDKTPGAGKSNVVVVTYESGKPIIAGYGGPFSDQVKYKQIKYLVDPLGKGKVTRMVFCHGSVFAALNVQGGPGQIVRIEVDDNYNILSNTVIATLPFPPVPLGLACDPRDDDANFKLYFSQSALYAQGGKEPYSPYGYDGQISYVMPNSPDKTVYPVVTNLGVSNHDHAVNQIAFHDDGRLLWAMGSNTNAGIKNIKLGGLDEGPLMAGLHFAKIRSPTFNGKMQYEFLANTPSAIKSKSPMDQMFTSWTKHSNPDIGTYAYGLRNAFGLTVSFSGKVMVSVNAANFDFGIAMLGMNPSTLQPVFDPSISNKGVQTKDATWLDLKEGCYLGHPNLALCRAGNSNVCAYISMETTTQPAGTSYCPATFNTFASCTGLIEHKAHVFNGAYDDWIFMGKYSSGSYHYDPSKKFLETDETSSGTYPLTIGIDVSSAPAGVHMASQYDDQNSADALKLSNYIFNIPSDPVVVANMNPSVYDVHPNKAARTRTGVNTFIIGGENFQFLPAVFTVKFGDAFATGLQVVGSHWIKGSIPAAVGPAELVSVTITYGTTTLTLPNSFRFLPDLPPVKAPPLVV